MDISAGIKASLAGRYASALFELASENGKVTPVESDLEKLASALAESADLAALTTNPQLTRDAAGKAIAAVGGRGGRRIPNAVLDLLLAHVVERRPFAEALAAPRLHTEGALAVEHEKGWPAAATSAWRTAGLAVKTGSSATLSAVAMEDGAWRAGMR